MMPKIRLYGFTVLRSLWRTKLGTNDRAFFLSAVALFCSITVSAQVGEHRNDFAFGGGAGVVLDKVGFVPNVPQNYHVGPMFGATFRYTCEKYFKSICAIQAEINYATMGWDENIMDKTDRPVVNLGTGKEEKYKRTMNYIQVPILARLGWGRENQGAQFYIVAGPQIGFFLNESTTSNFEYEDRYNVEASNMPASQIDSMEVMPVENKFDYGITAGVGFEYSMKRLGHFAIDARYYYGLGDFYGNAKKDFFGRSNHGAIVVKLSYLFDIKKTKGWQKIK